MKFDMGRALKDTGALIREHLNSLAILAGIFVLLPGLVTAFLFSSLQAQAMGSWRAMLSGQAPQAAPLAVNDLAGILVGSLIVVLVQFVGYMSLFATLREGKRTSVSDAIVVGLKSLPSLIGVMLLFVIAYFVAVLLVVAVATAASGAIGGIGSGIVIFVLVLGGMVGIFYVATKFSLTMPVIAIEGTLNPAKALLRSWRLTKGNSLRLFGFYLLLMVAYLIVAGFVFGLRLTVTSSSLAGQSTPVQFAAGTLNAVLTAALAVVAAAVFAAVHRQLAGPSSESLAETFQ